MKTTGIDIGSRTIALVEVEAGAIVRAEVTDTTHDPMTQVLGLLNGDGRGPLAATGYGRHLLRDKLGAAVLTEIKAFAIGANAVMPGRRGVLDIGGQDVKVIGLDGDGKVADFEMNDRCAAGTGKFLEVMAKALGFSIEELGPAALKRGKPVKINSMCTVFAESEVVSLITAGESRENIAYGLHEAIADRVVAMLNRVNVQDDLFFAGGGAKNPCLAEILRRRLRADIYIPASPQTIGALGAALSLE